MKMDLYSDTRGPEGIVVIAKINTYIIIHHPQVVFSLIIQVSYTCSSHLCIFNLWKTASDQASAI